MKRCNNKSTATYASDKVWKNKIYLKEQKTSSPLVDTEEKPKLLGGLKMWYPMTFYV